MPLYMIHISQYKCEGPLTLIFSDTNTEYTQTAVTDPVLYVALYSTGDAPSEVDDYHWTFIVGPSHEEADSQGTLYNMEPRQFLGSSRPYGGEWCWLYNQPTVPLRGQSDLLARLMIAEVADMNMLQAIMLRWGEMVAMRTHVEWMSVKWVENVLKSLEEEDGCLGRRLESYESVEAEVCNHRNNHILILVARLVPAAIDVLPLLSCLLRPLLHSLRTVLGLESCFQREG